MHHRRTLPVWASVVALWLLPAFALAADPPPKQQAAPDAIVLLGGHLLEGTIVERVEGQYVVIETAEGTQQIQWASIKHINQSSHLDNTNDPNDLPASVQTRTDAWAGRAEGRLTFDAKAIALALFQEARDTSNGREGRRMGFGGGLGGQIGWLTFATPAFEGNSGNWYGWRFGSGVDVAYTGASKPSKSTLSEGAMVVDIPLFFGGQFGFGTLPTPQHWKGTMIGFDYRPSFIFVKYGSEQFQRVLNWAGFDVTLDFAAMHAHASAPEMQFRVVGQMVFPVAEEYWSGFLGLGFAWY